jgi:hypothetical protein
VFPYGKEARFSFCLIIIKYFLGGFLEEEEIAINGI